MGCHCLLSSRESAPILHFSQHLVLSVTPILAILVVVKWYVVVLICIFLLINYIENFSMCLLSIWIPLLWKIHISDFYLFCVDLSFFLLLSHRHSLYILNANLLPGKPCYHIYKHTCIYIYICMYFIKMSYVYIYRYVIIAWICTLSNVAFDVQCFSFWWSPLYKVHLFKKILIVLFLIGSDEICFHFNFHLFALEKEMATHSSVLAWRTPGTGQPGGLPSMRSHRVGHDWSDLAAAGQRNNRFS